MFSWLASACQDLFLSFAKTRIKFHCLSRRSLHSSNSVVFPDVYVMYYNLAHAEIWSHFNVQIAAQVLVCSVFMPINPVCGSVVQMIIFTLLVGLCKNLFSSSLSNKRRKQAYVMKPYSCIHVYPSLDSVRAKMILSCRLDKLIHVLLSPIKSSLMVRKTFVVSSTNNPF